MWVLEIKCIAAMLACLSGTGNVVVIERQFKTESACITAAVNIAANWNPGEGAWTFNCVRKA